MDRDKEALRRRLNRIAGQVEGIQRMIDNDRYCVDVMTQVSATRAALAKVSGLLLETHLQHCVHEAFSADNPGAKEEKITELLHLFDKNCRG